MTDLQTAAQQALEAPGCERLREWASIGPVQRAAVEGFLEAALAQQERDTAVHMTHCNQGEWLGVCKYGEEDCPALAQQEQKPVAEVVSRTERVGFGRVEDREDVLFLADLPVGTMLYTHPPRRETEQEPVAWSTRERFYEALDRAVKNVRQEMQIKTVTMRRKDHDVALPIIDAYSGHVLVGDPPRREWQSLPACEDKPHAVLVDGYGYVDVRAVRAVEQALKERNT
jgi:hypothetical protein